MAGALVIVPISVTVWLILWIGAMLGKWGESFLGWLGLLEKLPTKGFEYGGINFNYAGAVGIIVALIIVYFVGMLANFWLFRKFFNFLDSTLSSLPGIKTVYESVRDLMKLFGGGEGGKIGYAVLYTPPKTKIRMLGIVTNEHPKGLPDSDNRVIVYLPLAYMIGGPIVYAQPKDLERIDMPVETALKLAATAFVGLGNDKDKPMEPNFTDAFKSLKKFTGGKNDDEQSENSPVE